MKILNRIFIFVFAGQMAFGAGTQGGDSGTRTTPSGPSVNENANDSKKSNDSGSAQSMMMAGVLGAMAAKEAAAENYGAAAMYAAMAALSLIQAGEHGDAASGAGYTALNSDGGPGAADTQSLSSSAGRNVGSFNANTLKKGIKGVTVDFDKKTITANGKTNPLSDFSSASAMQAAGFGTDDITKVMDAAAAAEKKIAAKMGGTTVNGFAEGGGAGAGGVSYVDEPVAAGTSAGVGAGVSDLSDRGPAGVAGMTKDFNGEPIGVAGDSIFEMMNRRYILKDKQNAFINENEVLLKQK